jgi:hypothetical protein
MIRTRTRRSEPEDDDGGDADAGMKLRAQRSWGLNVCFAPMAVIVADKTARSSAGALPTSVCNLKIMSLPKSALAGERFTHTRTCLSPLAGSPREAGFKPTWLGEC